MNNEERQRAGPLAPPPLPRRSTAEGSGGGGGGGGGVGEVGGGPAAVAGGEPAGRNRHSPLTRDELEAAERELRAINGTAATSRLQAALARREGGAEAVAEVEAEVEAEIVSRRAIELAVAAADGG